MLFKKLIFDNYKTYYGHQEIDFYIPSDIRNEKEKNIILLGGLNGAGKTTILKAILYVLFGKRGITEQEHKRLFSNTINNSFFDEGGRDCSVSLVLETDRGEDWELQVKWSFDNYKRLLNENRSLSIRKAGNRHGKKIKIDNIEAFNRIIDKIIPYNAAPFFIFDGEEIKDIILRQNSSEMKEAIHKITGMEAYKQLLSDLKSIKITTEQGLAKAVSQTKLNSLNSELAEVEEELNKLEIRKSKSIEESNKLESLIDNAKKARNDKLTLNSKSREVIINRQGKISTELQLAKKDFESYFKENAINIILNKKIINLKKQLKLEKDIRYKKIMQEASLTPYRSFMNQLLNKDISPPLSTEQLEQIKRIGEEIWAKENNINLGIPNGFVEIHDISSNDQGYLLNLVVKDKNHIIELINKIEKLNRQMDDLETEIRNAPESVDITKENNAIDILVKKLGEQNLKHRAIMNKINKAKEKKSSILNQLTRLAEQGSGYEELKERLDYINRIIKALNEYVTQNTIMKANFIKDEFSSMLVKLFRKQDEFGKIEFDIDSYTIRLFNDRNQEISIQDRSAGEMQMISSALIWALTKASDLSLPMVIDTPLGRLDSYHRNHLINHYYKHLSEQVIILSTDTEITKEYVDLMKNNSYKQYMLDYDEDKKYTIIRDGYFNFVRL
ncbi:DNA sulfur modification protein DndD [Fredinandcohnia onubensis]|uniref:DNA sulfur modification protein DndD n=1 Tax=Fredinandcohnia onubensis TaxID=1571209 RepID=UPI000C0BE77D|nr:DNA sulfur modification protein DndD [Fredinandcohnia onubensis]